MPGARAAERRSASHTAPAVAGIDAAVPAVPVIADATIASVADDDDAAVAVDAVVATGVGVAATVGRPAPVPAENDVARAACPLREAAAIPACIFGATRPAQLGLDGRGSEQRRTCERRDECVPESDHGALLGSAKSIAGATRTPAGP
jgi:hypothetical protein